MLYLVEIFIHLEQDLPVLQIKLRNELLSFFKKIVYSKTHFWSI